MPYYQIKKIREEGCLNSITKATMLGLTLGMFSGIGTPAGASAEEAPICTQANVPVVIEGKTFAKFDIYEKGTYYGDKLRTLRATEIQPITNGIHYWYDALKVSQENGSIPLINLYPTEGNSISAHASSDVSTIKGNGNSTRLATYFINGLTVDSNTPAASIDVAESSSTELWYLGNLSIIPINATKAAYSSSILHEMFHALGVVANVIAKEQEHPEYINESGYIKQLNVPVDLADNKSAFANNLYDYAGNALQNAKSITLVNSIDEVKKKKGNFM